MFLRHLLLLALLASFAITVEMRPSDASDDEDYEDSEEGNEPEKVYGGGYATVGKFPFLAVVNRLGDNSKVVSVCSGSVISERWVLTAAHCVYGSPGLFLLGFGLLDQENNNRYLQSTSGRVTMISARVYVHPKFDQLGKYDMGLVLTPRPIPFGATIKPIRLVGDAYADETFGDWDGYMFGWGPRGTNRNAADRLSFGEVAIKDYSYCPQYWGLSSEHHMCTVPSKLAQICQGSHGGPLVVRDDDDEFLQIGIVIFQSEYCPGFLPLIHTRLTSHHSWIKNKTEIEFD